MPQQGGSSVPELLPDEMLSVLDEEERSRVAAAIGSDRERKKRGQGQLQPPGRKGEE
jgi:hypothetical protein